MSHRFLRIFVGLTFAVLLLGAGTVPAAAAAAGAGAGASHSLDDPPADNDGDGIPDDTDQCPFEAGVPENYGCPYVGPIDSDGDGVYDDGSDLCPNEPGLPEYGGCPAPDSDGDGIVDPSDPCPNEPGPPEHGGCPVPDSDGDGFTDDVDACPYEYGDSSNGGCPYVPPPTDSDGDGVYDDTDQCPGEPGPASYNGCPVPDSDGDGLADDVDACPDLPGPYDGCPLTDLDGDGVYDDGSDLCPNEPGLPEHNGCPAPDSDGDGMNDDVDQCDDTPPGTPIDGLGCSLTVVTAAPPTFTDRCGKGQDTVTVPTSEGVVYRLGGNVVAAGTYRVKGTVRVFAEAADGYVLTGGAEWNMVMTNKVCPRGRLKVRSTAPGQVRVVNREAVAMTIQLGSKTKRVEPGAARIIWMTSGPVAWSVRWKSSLISARSGSVDVL